MLEIPTEKKKKKRSLINNDSRQGPGETKGGVRLPKEKRTTSLICGTGPLSSMWGRFARKGAGASTRTEGGYVQDALGGYLSSIPDWLKRREKKNLLEKEKRRVNDLGTGRI